jgi:hypothetical protein
MERNEKNLLRRLRRLATSKGLRIVRPYSREPHKIAGYSLVKRTRRGTYRFVLGRRFDASLADVARYLGAALALLLCLAAPLSAQDIRHEVASLRQGPPIMGFTAENSLSATILVPPDFGRFSDRAPDFALRIKCGHDARSTLVLVYENNDLRDNRVTAPVKRVPFACSLPGSHVQIDLTPWVSLPGTPEWGDSIEFTILATEGSVAGWVGLTMNYEAREPECRR